MKNLFKEYCRSQIKKGKMRFEQPDISDAIEDGNFKNFEANQRVSGTTQEYEKFVKNNEPHEKWLDIIYNELKTLAPTWNMLLYDKEISIVRSVSSFSQDRLAESLFREILYGHVSFELASVFASNYTALYNMMGISKMPDIILLKYGLYDLFPHPLFIDVKTYQEDCLNINLVSFDHYNKAIKDLTLDLPHMNIVAVPKESMDLSRSKFIPFNDIIQNQNECFLVKGKDFFNENIEYIRGNYSFKEIVPANHVGDTTHVRIPFDVLSNIMTKEAFVDYIQYACFRSHVNYDTPACNEL